MRQDGAAVWMRFHGELLYDAQQRPVRITGIAIAIPGPTDTENLLRSIAAGVSVATGETFFRLLVERLCAVLKTDSACVSALDESDPDLVHAFALFAGGQFLDQVDYRLSGTPCEQALTVGRSSYPRGVQSFFPQDHWLVENQIEAYLGVPLIGSSGQPLGVMSVMSRSPLTGVDSAETILNIFASRASSELERLRHRTAAIRVENELEEKQRFIGRLAETTPNVLFVYDLIERRNVYVNERSVDVIGYTPEEIIGLGDRFIPQCLHPDDLAALAQLGEDYARRRDGEVFGHVFRMKHKNGAWRWVHRSATVFSRTPDGAPKQILGAVTDITRFKENEEELQRLSARLLNIQDEERRRIARELHDVTGQNLASIGFNLASIGGAALEPAAKELLLECQKLCEQSQKEIRTLSYLLHPPLLDQFGLIGALEWYIDGLRKRTQMTIVLDVEHGIGRLSMELETDLFRVVQEALTNSVRYSGSDTTTIRLSKKNSNLILQIEDRGHGFALQGGIGVGIPSMRERLRHHGGSLQVRSGDRGTTLLAQVPVRGKVVSSEF
jgi:PAS domain S-box-containing protein